MNGLGYDLNHLDLVLRSHEPVGALLRVCKPSGQEAQGVRIRRSLERG